MQLQMNLVRHTWHSQPTGVSRDSDKLQIVCKLVLVACPLSSSWSRSLSLLLLLLPLLSVQSWPMLGDKIIISGPLARTPSPSCVTSRVPLALA